MYCLGFQASHVLAAYNHLAPVEKSVNLACQKASAWQVPQESGRIRKLIGFIWRTAITGGLIYSLFRTLTSPSREYKVEELDFYVALGTGVAWLVSPLIRAKYLSPQEARKKEMIDLWQRFIENYHVNTFGNMRESIKGLEYQAKYFPNMLKDVAGKEAGKILSWMKGMSYLFEIQSGKSKEEKPAKTGYLRGRKTTPVAKEKTEARREICRQKVLKHLGSAVQTELEQFIKPATEEKD